MKKIIFTFITIVTAVLLSFCSKKESNDFQGAIITHINGDVQISSLSDSTKFIKFSPDKIYSKEGMILPGQIVKTGKNSRVDLQLKDGILFRVGPESQILLKETKILSGENFSKVEIDLKKGKVFTTVGKMQGSSSYTVTAPTAIAGVRGTDFMVKTDGNVSEVLVEEGSVEVSSDKGEEIVNEGNKAVSTDAEIKVSELSEADKAELSEMGSGIESIKDEYKNQLQDIIANFEENKKLMEEALEEQKTRDRELVDEQKSKDREMLEEQKARDRENMDAVKGQGKEDMDEQSRIGKEGMDEQSRKGKEGMSEQSTKGKEGVESLKNSDKSGATGGAKSALDQIKNAK